MKQQVFKPTNIGLKLVNPKLEMKSNEIYPLNFVLQNYDQKLSSSLTFRISDSLNLIHWSDEKITLRPNEILKRKIDLKPSSIPKNFQGATDQITFYVLSTSDNESENYIIKTYETIHVSIFL